MKTWDDVEKLAEELYQTMLEIWMQTRGGTSIESCKAGFATKKQQRLYDAACGFRNGTFD